MRRRHSSTQVYTYRTHKLKKHQPFRLLATSSKDSGTSASRRRATLASVLAAPCFLGDRPPRHPIRKPSIAVVGQRCDCTPSRCRGAALAMHSATPCLLVHRPPSHPILEAICAIVRVGRSRWHDRHHRWRNRRYHHWWRCRRAATTMDAATPCLLVCCPGRLVVNCAIEWVNWPNWRRRRRRRRGRDDRRRSAAAVHAVQDRLRRGRGQREAHARRRVRDAVADRVGEPDAWLGGPASRRGGPYTGGGPKEWRKRGPEKSELSPNGPRGL